MAEAEGAAAVLPFRGEGGATAAEACFTEYFDTISICPLLFHASREIWTIGIDTMGGIVGSQPYPRDLLLDYVVARERRQRLVASTVAEISNRVAAASNDNMSAWPARRCRFAMEAA